MPRLSQLLVSRDRQFFDLFEEAASNIMRAADLLDQMLRGYPENAGLARELLICEQEGDRITHDIIDLTEEVSDYLGLYRIEAPMEQSQRMAHILVQATRQVAEALPRMRGFKDLNHYTVEINRLENDGDRVTREAMASLFDNGIDPMVVIRWKDIYERLESAIDATEQVANILETVVIKNS